MEALTSSLLYLNGVTVSFDGFKALNNLSFAIEPGEMRAIIGPNGAGKTTMMDVVTGKTRPDVGDVLFDGSYNLTKLDESRNRGTRHRSQVSEADGVRKPNRQSTTSNSRLNPIAAPAPPCGGGKPRLSGGASTNYCRSSA